MLAGWVQLRGRDMCDAPIEAMKFSLLGSVIMPARTTPCGHQPSHHKTHTVNATAKYVHF
jgi:hypothetical protein